MPVLGYYVDKGKVISSLKLAAYKDGIKYLAKLYKEGLIYEGSFTQDADVVRKIVESGDLPVVGAAPPPATAECSPRRSATTATATSAP